MKSYRCVHSKKLLVVNMDITPAFFRPHILFMAVHKVFVYWEVSTHRDIQ